MSIDKSILLDAHSIVYKDAEWSRLWVVRSEYAGCVQLRYGYDR